MMIKNTLIVLLLIVSITNARQVMLNEFCKYDSTVRVYTTHKTIEINTDDTLTILSGTEIQFKPFTGICVKGHLIAHGDKEKPIILTSKKSSSGKGSPFDWLGIRLYPGANSRLSFTNISFSSYGIKSCCENISLHSVVFYSNGVNISIGERTLPVDDNNPFSIKPVNGETDKSESTIEPVSHISSDRYKSIVNKTYIPQRTYIIAPLSVALLITGSLITYDNISDPMAKEVFSKKIDQFLYCGPLGYCLTAMGLIGGTYATIFTINY